METLRAILSKTKINQKRNVNLAEHVYIFFKFESKEKFCKKFQVYTLAYRVDKFLCF